MTNKQTDKRNKKTIAPDRVGDYNKATKQKDYTSPALAGAGDYNEFQQARVEMKLVNCQVNMVKDMSNQQEKPS